MQRKARAKGVRSFSLGYVGKEEFYGKRLQKLKACGAGGKLQGTKV